VLPLVATHLHMKQSDVTFLKFIHSVFCHLLRKQCSLQKDQTNQPDIAAFASPGITTRSTQKNNYVVSMTANTDNTWSSGARKASQGLRTFKATFASNMQPRSPVSKSSSLKSTSRGQKALQSRIKPTAQKKVTFSKSAYYQKNQARLEDKRRKNAGRTFFHRRNAATGITSSPNTHKYGSRCPKNSSANGFQTRIQSTVKSRTSGGSERLVPSSQDSPGKSMEKFASRKCSTSGGTATTRSRS